MTANKNNKTKKRATATAALKSSQQHEQEERKRDDVDVNDDDEHKKKEQRATNSPHEKSMAILIVLLAFVRLFYRWYNRPHTFISCTDEQAFVKESENYLLPWEFEKLKKCTMEHPRLENKNALHKSSFAKTRGFVVKFNEEGISSFINHPDYGDCFGELFKKMRLPDTNAYVLNTLLCELSEYEEWKNNLTAVGLHLDQTVGMQGLKADHQFLAHQVNVFYVDVADDMQGGELEVWKYGNGSLKENEYLKPHKSVKPVVNKLVEFRGDSFHQVKAYHTRANSQIKRLSIVLEQYKIREEFMENTIDFLEALKANMTMM